MIVSRLLYNVSNYGIKVCYMKNFLPLGLALFVAGCASMNTTMTPTHWELLDAVNPALVVVDEEPDSVRVVLHTAEVIVMSEPKVVEDRLMGSEQSILLEEIDYLEVWVKSEERESSF